MQFNVFGTVVEIQWKGHRWQAFYPGTDGTRRPAKDIIVPPDLNEDELSEYLADLCHEWATASQNDVTKLD